jgi:hypothetical protein
MFQKTTLNTHIEDNKILLKTNEFSMFSKKIFDHYEFTDTKTTEKRILKFVTIQYTH